MIFNRHASVPLDDESAAIARPLRKKLESHGKVIGPHDLQIAAIALRRHFLSHFSTVESTLAA
jgi:predicted nucleic acid-binding protein